MNVGIIGFGYIGAVCSAALLLKEHSVLIYDKNQEQISGVAKKVFAFPEKDVEEIINNKINSIHVANDYVEFVDVDIVVVCVNTSLQTNGRLNYSNIVDVLESLGRESFNGKVIIRSTLPLDDDLITFLERNYKFQLFVLPEFLREGSALADLVGSKNTVIGFQTGSLIEDDIVELFSFEHTDVHAMPIRDAIFTKLLNNTWHALKVAFANEWNAIACENGITDTSRIYQAFVSDKHLNISEKYLRPGGPFGGPCLPKDISEFSALAGSIPAYISEGAIRSNADWTQALARDVERKLIERGEKKFGFDTYEFKKGTEDTRYSPISNVASILKQRGFCQDDDNGILFCGRSLLDNGIIKFANSRQ